MHKFALVGVITVLSMPGAAFAQGVDSLHARTILLPGSLNVSIGTLAPGEPGNVVSSVTTEQGFTPFRKGPVFVVGFANVSVRHDTEGFPWNRTMPSTAGLKLVTATRAGIIQAVVGVNAHVRGDDVRVSKAAYATYWTGWRGDIISAQSTVLPDALPGYAYASSGFVTAAEPDNWISSLSIQQGATVFRYSGIAVIPFVGASASADSSGHNWNNRTRVDAGIKITREVLSGVVDIGIAQRHELDHLTRDSRVAPVVFVNFWLGWSPALAVTP